MQGDFQAAEQRGIDPGREAFQALTHRTHPSEPKTGEGMEKSLWVSSRAERDDSMTARFHGSAGGDRSDSSNVSQSFFEADQRGDDAGGHRLGQKYTQIEERSKVGDTVDELCGGQEQFSETKCDSSGESADVAQI